MIDTDKYEGHSTEYTYEIVIVDDGKELIATYALLNDAPLLLEEVKRLREAIERAIGYTSEMDVLTVLCRALGQKIQGVD